MNLAEMYTGNFNFISLRNKSNDRVFIYGEYVDPGDHVVVPVDLATTVTGMVDCFEIQGLVRGDTKVGPVFGWDATYEPSESFEYSPDYQPVDNRYMFRQVRKR